MLLLHNFNVRLKGTLRGSLHSKQCCIWTYSHEIRKCLVHLEDLTIVCEGSGDACAPCVVNDSSLLVFQNCHMTLEEGNSYTLLAHGPVRAEDTSFTAYVGCSP